MWEAKAIAVLGCMSNLELIFEGVLAIMHSAVVPWSPGVEDLVQRYRGMEHASYFYESHYNEETGRLLFLVSQKLCHMLESNIPMVLPEVQDLPEVIYCMACQAATLCSPDLILDVLEFCKHASFAREIYAKCQMEDLGFLPQASSLQTEKDPYGAWTFEDFFTEDGAVLDTPAVLPSTYKIASSLVPLAGRLNRLHLSFAFHSP
ncbi:PREDICTED: kinetochore-associated protein 1-like [Thamnophis sirtalis]|uniref:Kinetochore-associated protein 1-like n=1 Tax=Thamnophis sirtalis TaxID=35019 RepID=A0A6I9Z010_9SAUR|nr:PREDICTED: kinetochore-associated protein 1-like [Thamnophis sirtalis]